MSKSESAISEGYTFAAAAQAVGVGEQCLGRWHARLAPKPPPCSEKRILGNLLSQRVHDLTANS